MLYSTAALVLLIAQSINGIGNPQACQSSKYVLAGEFVEFRNSNGIGVHCKYNNNPEIINNGSRVAFLEPGTYNYTCPNDIMLERGQFVVVSSQHKILLCDNCTNNLVIEVGDVVYWTRHNIECNLLLVDANCSDSFIATFGYSQGLQDGHQFTVPGVYHLSCGDCEPYATITVANTTPQYDRPLCPQQHTGHIVYKELLYSHAGIMAVTFGVVLPVGAVAASGHYSIAHVILQPIGLMLGVTGLVLVVVYKELNTFNHFMNLHEVVGFVILLIALCLPCLRLCVVLPVQKFWQEILKTWHKRLGIAVVFFGLSNVFLGLHVLQNTPVYVMAMYGVWVLVAVALFAVLGSVKRFNHRDNNSVQDEDLTNCWGFGKRRSTSDGEPDSHSIGPSKLTKEILSDNNYVTARKKSVDVLELRLDEPQKVEPQKAAPPPARQRKVSNVHFGPVAMAQLPPEAPATPIQDTSFGFSDRESSDDCSSDLDEREDNIPEEDEEEESDDGLMMVQSDADLLPTVVIRDSTCSLDSIPSNGGSVRITRHSKRADSKLSEIFERQRSSSIHSNQYTPSPVKEQRSLGDAVGIKPSPPDSLPLKCPFSRDNSSSSSLPLHMRRTRKNAHVMNEPPMDQPPNGDLLILPGRRSPVLRSPSPVSISKKQTSMLVDNTLRSVMKMSDNAIISANAQGEIVFWSSGAVKMFGYTPREAIGSSLQMIIPDRLREKHQNGVNKKTEYAMEYIKKHHVAPEEQKHARLYAVSGLSKTGQEFTVEVLVSSFVIEGEIFYTGIISELNNQQGLNRQLSSASLSSEAEIRERHQKAMAIGAQMKIVHKLKSAEHMSKRELTSILQSSLKSAQFEVPENDIALMVEGIVKAADPDETQIIKFVDLIDLLAKHRLYISDSGLIAKYGKSQATQSNLTWKQSAWSRVVSFFSVYGPAIFWFVMYFVLNVVLLLGGVLGGNREGLARWSYGLGPVLSLNCVLILLPALNGLKHALSSNWLFKRVLPMNCAVVFHVAMFGVIVFWSVIHVVTHLLVLHIEPTDANATFTGNLESSLDTFVTGLLVACLLVLMAITSFSCLRKFCRFVSFYMLHYGGMFLVYILLLIHGKGCWNPSFWKWLLPFIVVLVAERLYVRFVVPRYSVGLYKAARYDDCTRTTALEFERPKHFHFVPGQYVLINMPEIGYFNWQACIISGPTKERRLYSYLPNAGNPWLQQAFATYKTSPVKKKKSTADDGTEITPEPSGTVQIMGPFGSGVTLMFDYKVCVLLCGGNGPHHCKPVLQKFLAYARATACRCGCHPRLSKVYFVWMTPSGNDFEWFTDYLSELTEDKHLQKYLDIRIYLTNIDCPPDELASALLHLALKTGGPALSVRRPSQPQLSKLHANTSYGAPDFESLLDFVSMQQGTATDQDVECGVFSIGDVPQNVTSDLKKYCEMCSHKRGPTRRDSLPTSPYRYHDNSSSSPERDHSGTDEETPKEWHINFKYHSIVP